MPQLKESYAGVGLRHSLFLHDHPTAKAPVFEIVKSAEARIPDSFAAGVVVSGNGPTTGPEFSGEVIRCTLDPGNGQEPYVGYKEIPNWIPTKSGRQAFVRSPETWQKLCTMALGRTLKRASYPDDTNDLKAIIVWRRRDLELKALAEGQPLGALAPGPQPTEADIDRAAKPTPDYEHPEQGDHEDVIDTTATVTPEPESAASSEVWVAEAREKLAPIMEGMAPEQIGAVADFCAERFGHGAYGTLEGKQLKLVVAFAASQKGAQPARARSASKDQEAPKPPDPAPDPPTEAQTAAPEAQSDQSGESDTTAELCIDEEAFATLVNDFDALSDKMQERVLRAVGELADRDWATITAEEERYIRLRMTSVVQLGQS